LQSQDRIHRISQDKACRIFKLLAKNTIDEFIDKVIEMKRDIAGFVQNDFPDLSKSSIDFIHNKKELLNILG
jgi:SNF2 family DNA or RNA helicase